MTREPADYAEPRLAAIYDAFDGARDDLDLYESIVDELGASSVVDIGCGTGELAIRLAASGTESVGADPSRAMLAIARRKPGAERVRWIHADAAELPALGCSTATMTGNVAQVFLTDEDWSAALTRARTALVAGGHLVLESRVPERRAWERWTRDHTSAVADVPGVGEVEVWCDLVAVDAPLVTFRWTHRFAVDGSVLTSTSTLRFRSLDELVGSLAAAGFDVVDVRDAPDRPGAEHVLIARCG